MNDFFTSEDLIQLLYNEVCDGEASAMKKAMQTNTTLRKEFNALRKAKQSLPRFLMEPAGFIVDRILAHSHRRMIETA
jgi:hypothetical protein